MRIKLEDMMAYGEEINLEKKLNLMVVSDIQEMLKLLAENFSEKTTVRVVPKGTTRWAYLIVSNDAPFSTKTKVLELRRFFGMVMAYDKELDILIRWDD